MDKGFERQFTEEEYTDKICLLTVIMEMHNEILLILWKKGRLTSAHTRVSLDNVRTIFWTISNKTLT